MSNSIGLEDKLNKLSKKICNCKEFLFVDVLPSIGKEEILYYLVDDGFYYWDGSIFVSGIPTPAATPTIYSADGTQIDAVRTWNGNGKNLEIEDFWQINIIDGIGSRYSMSLNNDVSISSTFGRLLLGGSSSLELICTVIKLIGIPTYADDTAAGIGGLAVNTIYKTAGGDLKIKL